MRKGVPGAPASGAGRGVTPVWGAGGTGRSDLGAVGRRRRRLLQGALSLLYLRPAVFVISDFVISTPLPVDFCESSRLCCKGWDAAGARPAPCPWACELGARSPVAAAARLGSGVPVGSLLPHFGGAWGCACCRRPLGGAGSQHCPALSRTLSPRCAAAPGSPCLTPSPCTHPTDL